MSGLRFEITEAQAQRFSALPTIVFRLNVTNDAEPIEAIALRAQIRIEPQWRTYETSERALLEDLFGTPERWDRTLHALTWADVPVMVPAFAHQTQVDVLLACSYDFDLAASRFASALNAGEIPLRCFFSGSVFRAAVTGFSTERVPWSCECAYRLPLQVWRQAMQACYGDAAVIRIDRETLQMLQRLRARTGAPTWDRLFASLLFAREDAS